MFFGIRHEERRILVTSPNPGDGKTLTSVLLAASYAQAGFRTVLVAADLRHSDVERLLRVAEPDPLGLSDALVSPSLSLADSPEDDAPRHIVATDLANLWLLPAGTSAPNPTELLGSRRMTELLDELSLSFDIVVIDTAPVLPVADTRTLVESVDGVLLVSSIGASRRDLARTRDILKLADVNWLGLVLNRTTDVAASPYHEQRPTRRSRAGV
jgi:capsular exopolysaccharide synthesis family protein